MSDEERSPGLNLLDPSSAKRLFELAGQPPSVIPVPFKAWEEACRDSGGGEGLARGWHIVIGADTKQGKTLLAVQCALEAVTYGRRVGYVNLEMSVEQIQTRFYAQAMGIPAWKLEPGKGFDQGKADDVLMQLDKWQVAVKGVWFFVNEEPVVTLQETLELMKFWVQEWKCQLIIVDYMQLLENPESSGIADEIRKVSAYIRRFAREHNVVTIGLSQFSNEGGNNPGKPHAGSLYGGRRIAQDASQCLFLDHSRSDYDPLTQKTRTWLLLKYNRHGPGVEIPIEWDWQTLKAREAMPDEESQWPR